MLYPVLMGGIYVPNWKEVSLNVLTYFKVNGKFSKYMDCWVFNVVKNVRRVMFKWYFWGYYFDMSLGFMLSNACNVPEYKIKNKK